MLYNFPKEVDEEKDDAAITALVQGAHDDTANVGIKMVRLGAPFKGHRPVHTWW